MKKFIVLLISLFLGVILSNNTQIDKIEKNDITTLAVCTDNHIDVLSIDSPVVYIITSTGSDIQYCLANSISNHSTKINNVLLFISDYITYIRGNTLGIQSKVARIPTKTLGLLKTVVNKIDFNIYLYHVINKLGQT